VAETAKKVIIVESPTKAKTIKTYVGRAYTVVSSKGHIKDLPKSTLGVDVDNNFEPRYIKIKGKTKIIQEIKKACKKSSEIYIASDPDREGEAIAQHLAEELNSYAPHIKRVLFYEITPDYVKKALRSTTSINKNLVEAHKARRVLDRIVGYYTSPILWKVLKRGLSAGRVQSVALRLICERETEIRAFVPTPYWNAVAEFETDKSEKFKGTLWRIDGAVRKIANKDELARFESFLKQDTRFAVVTYRKTNPERVPPPPFITSSLQQEASRELNLPPSKTMSIAQSLYEGVKLPQGMIGLITYMRTDSVRVNAQALEELREYIGGKYGNEYQCKETRTYKDRRNAQAGHEAIRPTKMNLEPDTIKEHLTPDQYDVYKIIYNRYVCSQMAAARYAMKEAILEHMGIGFKAEEMKPVFLGYQLLSGDPIDRGFVPELKVGDPVRLCEVTYEEKQTEPLPRFTDASLIKKLEDNGIGRPSTYAHILQTLFYRRYVTREAGKIVPSELGFEVYKIIIPKLSNIFDVSFTARMEEELDQVEAGKKVWQDVVREFYDPFVVSLDTAKKESEKVKENMTPVVDKQCPKCQKPLIVRWGKYGKFLACSGFPECKYSENLAVEKTDRKCPKCGRDLIVRHGRFGEFLACSGYPDCRYTENKTHSTPCPICSGDVSVISGKRGKLYRCKACGFSSFYPPVDEKCTICGKGLVQKKNKRVCPVCSLKKTTEKPPNAS